MSHSTDDQALRGARKRAFRVFIGGFIVVGLVLMIVGPVTVSDDNWSSIGIIVVLAETLIVAAGFAWLVYLVRAKPDKHGPTDPSSH